MMLRQDLFRNFPSVSCQAKVSHCMSTRQFLVVELALVQDDGVLGVGVHPPFDFFEVGHSASNAMLA